MRKLVYLIMILALLGVSLAACGEAAVEEAAGE